MDIKKLLNDGSDAEIYSTLKNKKSKVKFGWDKLSRQYDSTCHPVNDPNERPDKHRKGLPDEKVSRIHLELEKLITSRMVEFMFATPVKRIYSYDENDSILNEIVKAIESVYVRNRIDTENLKRARGLFASCEMATQWFPVKLKTPTNIYGIERSKYKFKTRSFSPMDGYDLYPLFDEQGDMVAMSVEYKADDDSRVMETFTEDRHLFFKNGIKEVDETNLLGKIPFVYAWRKLPIWDGVQHLVNELEMTLSRNSDVIAYNASPILVVSGELNGTENKGTGKRMYKVENGGSVNYVSWNQSIEAVKSQVDNLLRLIWMTVQLPDLSFENIKGLGAVSGEARKTLLTDAHLKVGDEKGVFLEYFDRECNIIKAELALANPKWAGRMDEIEVEHVITPFIQNDEMAEVQKWLLANGGKPVVSQLEAIKLLGMSADPNNTYEQIRKEAQEDAGLQASMFETKIEDVE